MPGIASFVYSTLGRAYLSLGDYAKAIEYHTQHLAIAKEVGDRAGKGRAYANLGCTYGSQENYAKAIDYHTQYLAIAKEVGDRAGEGKAYKNLGTCHMHLNEYVNAVAYFEAHHAMAMSLKLAHMQSDAAINIGVSLTLHVRAARRGPATGDDRAHGPCRGGSRSITIHLADTLLLLSSWPVSHIAMFVSWPWHLVDFCYFGFPPSVVFSTAASQSVTLCLAMTG